MATFYRCNGYLVNEHTWIQTAGQATGLPERIQSDFRIVVREASPMSLLSENPPFELKDDCIHQIRLPCGSGLDFEASMTGTGRRRPRPSSSFGGYTCAVSI